MTKVTRQTLIAKVQEDLQVSQDEAAALVTAILSESGKILQEGCSLVIKNFGKLSVEERQEKTGYDFKAGKVMKVAKQKKIVFRPSRTYIELLKATEE